MLIFLISNLAYSQEFIWDQDKDLKMRKIEKIVNGIDNDTSLIRFRFNNSLTNSVIDSSSFIYEIENHTFQTVSNRSSANYYYLKNSVIVKLIYDGQTFYFFDENLIMSYKKYEGFSDNTTQCCPITTEHYHYYWKNAYYKSFEKRDSNCANPCSYIIASNIDKKTINLLVEKIKTFANKK